MSALTGKKRTFSQLLLILAMAQLQACGDPLNNPYPTSGKPGNNLYTSFEERPKHLDPARSYASNEYEIISQIYEPLLQYAYLKRPFQLEPLAASELPTVSYIDQKGQILPADTQDADIAYSDYEIRLRKDLRYQPHPALALTPTGDQRYLNLTPADLAGIRTLDDFPETGTRQATAEDYLYQIKRLVHPEIHSPIAELMKDYIVGLKELETRLQQESVKQKDKSGWLDLRPYPLEGVTIINPYHLKIRIKGKYPQFRFWLAMPFFSPMPWEADAFYQQPGLISKNITLDWFPIGTGPYQMAENNPNRRIILIKNPNFHEESYPTQGEPEDNKAGLLKDAGQKLPFIDQVIFILEKETIPYWNKFLQGYYDASGIASDNFDQAIQLSGQGNARLTEEMQAKGIKLQTDVEITDLYMGFNMLDPVVGGLEPQKAKLRRAISLAIDEEEFIAIFLNGRGIPAQGLLPPGLFGAEEGQKGINPYLYEWKNGTAQRKSLAEARQLMTEAGYPQGHDSTGKPLVLFLDTTARGPDDKAILNWYRKQFEKLGIQLILRTTDYNQFQQKMANGNAQLFRWGWNADYPDPENFFFLLYGPNAKATKGGENATNYSNPDFDQRFERMRSMADTQERLELIQQMQEILRRDSPWVFGLHPKSYGLGHSWYLNRKPNPMANNNIKYLRIDGELREKLRKQWNQPIVWPVSLLIAITVAGLLAAMRIYHRRQQATARKQ